MSSWLKAGLGAVLILSDFTIAHPRVLPNPAPNTNPLTEIPEFDATYQSTAHHFIERRSSDPGQGMRCSATQIGANDTCDTLAATCGISTRRLVKLNAGDNTFCSTLKEGQLICCSKWRSRTSSQTTTTAGSSQSSQTASPVDSGDSAETDGASPTSDVDMGSDPTETSSPVTVDDLDDSSSPTTTSDSDDSSEPTQTSDPEDSSEEEDDNDDGDSSEPTQTVDSGDGSSPTDSSDSSEPTETLDSDDPTGASNATMTADSGASDPTEVSDPTAVSDPTDGSGVSSSQPSQTTQLTSPIRSAGSSQSTASLQSSSSTQQNSTGAYCTSHTIKSGQDCDTMAAAAGITKDQLIQYNAKTWSWNGCDNLQAGMIICISSGDPPFPAPLKGAICGPQVPGTAAPPAGTNFSTMNPCALNACCNIWGQCGISDAFCVDTNTGAPGTARAGTNGCISNCGMNVISSGPPALYRAVGYYEGYGLDRPCLYQDASQIDTSQFTTLHFAFGILTSDYQVTIGKDETTNYEFKKFLQIKGSARVLSIGGWAFSSDPSTYNIFREGTAAANRNTLATNIANFINQNGLDGVDIDWEYPGSPDDPGIPAGSASDGQNLLGFLAVLKPMLGSKTLSIAAPASYFYLKNYPIDEIADVLDYLVLMTYDMHGQWDMGDPTSQSGCPAGNCLRSHVNLTETISALAMITKAGVPSNKVVVGITSYGRTFAMTNANCYTAGCTHGGTSTKSNAAQGPCSKSSGILFNAEIKSILQTPSLISQNYIDQSSNTNILVYNQTQWVGWMDATVKANRKSIYQGLNFGGTSDWATDMEDYHDPPSGAKTWTAFINGIYSGTYS